MSATATVDQANAKPQAASGRDERGRFTNGNKGGPGNPFARKVAALRKAVVDFVKPHARQEPRPPPSGGARQAGLRKSPWRPCKSSLLLAPALLRLPP